jgi:hypothetical protein
MLTYADVWCRYKETRPKQIERLMSVLAEGGAYAHLAAMPR